MKLKFAADVWYWRGPAPFYFLSTPPQESAEIKSVSHRLTYGWGCIPVKAKIGKTEWTTALIPKDGSYLVPLKKIIRTELGLDEGSTASITLEFEEKY